MAPRKGQCEDVHLFTCCEVYPTCLTVSSFEVTVVTGAGVAPEDFITRTTIVAWVTVTLQEVWNFTDALYNVVHVITTVFHEKSARYTDFTILESKLNMVIAKMFHHNYGG